MLGHVTQAGEVKPVLPLEQLHRDVAVRLDFGPWKMEGIAQRHIIVQNPVVSQSEIHRTGPAGEGVVVVVSPRTPLRRHAGMAHDDGSVPRNVEAHPVRGHRPLVDPELSSAVVGDSRGVCAPNLTGRREVVQRQRFMPSTHPASVVHQAK